MLIRLTCHHNKGVLNRITGLIRRRQFNIKSISAGGTETKDIAHVFIQFDTDKTNADQVIKQLNKLIEVIKVEEIPNDHLNLQPILIKIQKDEKKLPEIQEILKKYLAHLAKTTQNSYLISAFCSNEQSESILKELKPFNIKRYTITGPLSL